MTDQMSARLALPLLAAGQAGKELTHNEALTRLDMLVQPAVIGIGGNTPPQAPQPGQCWIVGATPTGAWSGRAGAIAGWTAGGWRFVAARAGLCARHLPSGETAVCDGIGWQTGEVRATSLVVDGVQVVGARGPAITVPSSGATIDAELRACVEAILIMLRKHGLIAS